MLHSLSKICSVPQDGSSMSLLTVGGKFGKVSVWRIPVPECYSVDQSRVPATVALIGMLLAHNSWITAIGWALLDSDSSNPKVLLATTSTDGSVRIWMGNNEKLLKSSEPSDTSFSLLKERGGADASKQFVNKAIAELELETLLSSKTFRIADLGCSVGPNTFFSVENIIEALQLKCNSLGLNSQIPEFQVFFNDHASNDFNLLFNSLPHNRQYYAAGVPGSFHGRLFPNSSIHLFHSSFSIPWISRVPKEVVNKNSPAWNKGRIFYSNATDEVLRAYEAQNVEDMECFLNARAQEIVNGGLMVLIIPGRQDDTPHSQSLPNMVFQILGSCLMEMARKGIVDEEKVDSFNLPNYFMSSKELEAAIERNGLFSVERWENLHHFAAHDIVYNIPQLVASQMRATTEELIKQQFGDEILDELFDLYGKRVAEQQSVVVAGKAMIYVVVLKRKAKLI